MTKSLRLAALLLGLALLGGVISTSAWADTNPRDTKVQTATEPQQSGTQSQTTTPPPESEQQQPAQTEPQPPPEKQPQEEELPQTASYLPLIGLVGLLSLGTALSFRLLQKRVS